MDGPFSKSAERGHGSDYSHSLTQDSQSESGESGASQIHKKIQSKMEMSSL